MRKLHAGFPRGLAASGRIVQGGRVAAIASGRCLRSAASSMSASGASSAQRRPARAAARGCRAITCGVLQAMPSNSRGVGPAQADQRIAAVQRRHEHRVVRRPAPRRPARSTLRIQRRHVGADQQRRRRAVCSARSSARCHARAEVALALRRQRHAVRRARRAKRGCAASGVPHSSHRAEPAATACAERMRQQALGQRGRAGRAQRRASAASWPSPATGALAKTISAVQRSSVGLAPGLPAIRRASSASAAATSARWCATRRALPSAGPRCARAGAGRPARPGAQPARQLDVLHQRLVGGSRRRARTARGARTSPGRRWRCRCSASAGSSARPPARSIGARPSMRTSKRPQRAPRRQGAVQHGVGARRAAACRHAGTAAPCARAPAAPAFICRARPRGAAQHPVGPAARRGAPCRRCCRRRRRSASAPRARSGASACSVAAMPAASFSTGTTMRQRRRRPLGHQARRPRRRGVERAAAAAALAGGAAVAVVGDADGVAAPGRAAAGRAGAAAPLPPQPRAQAEHLVEVAVVQIALPVDAEQRCGTSPCPGSRPGRRRAAAACSRRTCPCRRACCRSAGSACWSARTGG